MARGVADFQPSYLSVVILNFPCVKKMYDIIYLGSFISITGANPYPGMNRDQVIAQLHIGYRMPKPQYCSDEV